DEQDSRMARPDVAQPANFLLQVGLTELWRHCGVEPIAIVGHSVGEVAAAWASGALSLEDAVAVSWYRSRLQQRLDGQGRMLAVGLPGEEALALIEGLEGLVSLAGVNGPTGSVLAGDPDALEEVASSLEAKGVFQ